MRNKTIVCIMSDDQYYPEIGESKYSKSFLIQHGNKIYGSLANAISHETKHHDLSDVFKALFKDLGLKMPNSDSSVTTYFECIEELNKNDFRVMNSIMSYTGKLDNYRESFPY